MDYNQDYHERQFQTPYRSTIAFDRFLDECNANMDGSKILDLACGGGQNEWYFASRYPKTEFVGIDFDKDILCRFETYIKKMNNVTLKHGDWFCLDPSLVNRFDGVISLQALSWLSEWKKPLKEVCKLNPKWIAMSSLFYEGKIEYQIRSFNYERESDKKEHIDAYYNIYSLPIIKTYLRECGYPIFRFKRFEIDIDIPKPQSNDWGTYTIKTEAGKRLQISAAMMLPWYFFYAAKQ